MPDWKTDFLTLKKKKKKKTKNWLVKKRSNRKTIKLTFLISLAGDGDTLVLFFFFYPPSPEHTTHTQTHRHTHAHLCTGTLSLSYLTARCSTDLHFLEAGILFKIFFFSLRQAVNYQQRCTCIDRGWWFLYFIYGEKKERKTRWPQDTVDILRKKGNVIKMQSNVSCFVSSANFI